MILFFIYRLLFPRIPVSSLVDSWLSLLALLKDSLPLGLPAPGQFLILGSVSPPSLMSSRRVGSLAPLELGITYTVIFNRGQRIIAKTVQ